MPILSSICFPTVEHQLLLGSLQAGEKGILSSHHCSPSTSIQRCMNLEVARNHHDHQVAIDRPVPSMKTVTFSIPFLVNPWTEYAMFVASVYRVDVFTTIPSSCSWYSSDPLIGYVKVRFFFAPMRITLYVFALSRFCQDTL